MRILTLALLAGFTLHGLAAARAADLDYGVLRGPDYEPVSQEIDWNGGYVGGHGGYTSTSQNYKTKYFNTAVDYFTRSSENVQFASSVVSASANLKTFERRADGTGYGGYAGYNYMFDETVIGVEVDYTRLNSASQSRYSQDTSFFDSTKGANIPLIVNGIASTEIVDFGTARVRAGYALGNFLPFVTGGIAIGRAKFGQQLVINSSDPSYNRVISEKNPDSTTSYGILGPFTKTKVVGGLALGAGVEFALTQNIILRGEYQYILFNDLWGGKTNVDTLRGANLNTVRGGAAVKF